MAVTLTASQLAAAIRSDVALATRLLSVSSELVLRYAPDAPEAIQNEAVVRTSGYLASHPPSAMRSGSAGPLSAEYNPASLSALRHSGAMAVLSAWKVRRATVA